MKSLLCILLALVMCMAMVGCGETSAPATQAPTDMPTEAPTAAPTQPPEPVVLPEGVAFGEYFVKIVGAERIRDVQGADAVRFYLDFTNNSENSVAAGWELSLQATQQDQPCEAAVSQKAVAPEDYLHAKVRPGCAVRVADAYRIDPQGGKICFSVSFPLSEEVLTLELDPNNMPGAPDQTFEITPVAEPNWMESYVDSGVCSSDTQENVFTVSIGEAEIVDGWNEPEVLIRVYFQFTNNSSQAKSMVAAMDILAFQDGIELKTGLAEETVEEEKAYTTEIEPGQTVTCALCWVLRTESTVEIQVNDYKENIGCLYNLE